MFLFCLNDSFMVSAISALASLVCIRKNILYISSRSGAPSGIVGTLGTIGSTGGGGAGTTVAPLEDLLVGVIRVRCIDERGCSLLTPSRNLVASTRHLLKHVIQLAPTVL